MLASEAPRRARAQWLRHAALAVLAALASPSVMAIEEPGFRLVERDGAFELREYEAHLVAETRVEADFERAGNVAFRRLFDYISGENAPRRKIEMTAPVTQSRGEKIAMTAPVTQAADAGAYRVAFVVPSKYTAATVPQPLDPRIEIREVPARLVAVWSYSGRWTTTNYEEAEKALRAALARRGLEPAGEPILARYDPPFKPWFMRRNEVLIPVRRK
jgi:hypothetical protein